MMDLKKIGAFISNARKEKGLTQKQLAAEIGVSDKAISRWETGRGMPDTGIMQNLCRILDINVNELLSGEYLSVEAYSGKAEDNMVKLIEDNEQVKKRNKENTVGTMIGIVMLLLFLIGVILFGRGQIGWFVDVPSFLAVTGAWLIIVGISGQFSDFFRGVSIAFHSGRVSEKNNPEKNNPGQDNSEKNYSKQDISEQAQCSEYAVDFGIKAMIFSGAVSSIIGIVLSLGMLGDPSRLGPTLAVAILTAFYAAIFGLIFMVVKGRVHRFI